MPTSARQRLWSTALPKLMALLCESHTCVILFLFVSCLVRCDAGREQEGAAREPCGCSWAPLCITLHLRTDAPGTVRPLAPGKTPRTARVHSGARAASDLPDACKARPRAVFHVTTLQRKDVTTLQRKVDLAGVAIQGGAVARRLPILNIQHGPGPSDAIGMPVAAWLLGECLLHWAARWRAAEARPRTASARVSC